MPKRNVKQELTFAEIYHTAILEEIKDWQGADVEIARQRIQDHVRKIKEYKPACDRLH